MIKKIVFIILVFVAGLALGNFVPWNAQPANEDSRYEDLKAKFDKLSSVDFEEYVQLKNQKEKYEKADEIFGKILTIFLYDLGIRSSQKQLVALKQAVVSDTPQTVAIVRANTENATETRANETVATKNNEWIQRGARAKELYTDAEVKDFLDSIEIKDFFSALKSAGSLTSGQVQVLNGNYSGEIVFDDKSKQSWQVQMNLNGQVVDGVLTGRNLIRLSKDGKVFSNSRGRGGLKNFQSFAGDENAFLVDANNGDSYMQLYNIERMNMLSGLFYDKTGVGQFTRVGTVILKK